MTNIFAAFIFLRKSEQNKGGWPLYCTVWGDHTLYRLISLGLPVETAGLQVLKYKYMPTCLGGLANPDWNAV